MNRRLCATVMLLIASATAIEAAETRTTNAANRIEVYKVRWWGTEGSERDRPIYRVAHVDNGQTEIHCAVVPGRRLDDYRMPYWPVTSCLSILNRPAEICQSVRATFDAEGKSKTVPLVVHEGFEFSTLEGADVLKITNAPSGPPLLMEVFLVIKGKDPTIQVLTRLTNTSGKPISNLRMAVVYEQDFNWSSFGASDGGVYLPAAAPVSNSARAFFAFSSGMERGYEFISGESCKLSYELAKTMNSWRVTLGSKPTTVAPGGSSDFRYVVRGVNSLPIRPEATGLLRTQTLRDLRFRTVKPTLFRTAPIRPDNRVMLPQLIDDLRRPKIRGLNLRATPPQALKDLQTLKDWGCNLVIAGIGEPGQTADLIEKGHRLGMEMFIAGSGSFRSGPPRFDALYGKPLPLPQQADSHGQDEDHYYWDSIRPTRDFETDFGKPMSKATQEEKVAYWGRCFRDKWKAVLAEVRKHAPQGNIWFYYCSPGVANVDPLDYYDVFLPEITRLGKSLTVFAFYYGVEYNQPEYLMRRWKDAGAERAAFLPMHGFMARPSQFFRAITAARRGQSDGTCGFHFPVGGEKPDQQWQWKSVMLAAWANFPTSELNAYCFIEEPAELVEALARCDVTVTSDGTDVKDFLASLKELLPGEVRLAEGAAESPSDDNRGRRLHIVVGKAETLLKRDWAFDLRKHGLGPGKGVIQMQENVLSLRGSDRQGVANAMKLLGRFAQLARAEGRK